MDDEGVTTGEIRRGSLETTIAAVGQMLTPPTQEEPMGEGWSLPLASGVGGACTRRVSKRIATRNLHTRSGICLHGGTPMIFNYRGEYGPNPYFGFLVIP
jgi:hypothetical protein